MFTSVREEIERNMKGMTINQKIVYLNALWEAVANTMNTVYDNMETGNNPTYYDRIVYAQMREQMKTIEILIEELSK